MVVEELFNRWIQCNKSGKFVRNNNGDLQLKKGAPEEAHKLLDNWQHPKPDENGEIVLLD